MAMLIRVTEGHVKKKSIIAIVNDDFDYTSLRDDNCTASVLLEKVEDEIVDWRKVVTTKQYWDCECRKNYIHPQSQRACPECGAWASEQPDSRVDEVINEGLPL